MLGREELVKNLARTCREHTRYNLNLQKNIDAKNARIKELEATISKMETTQKWISVKDRLPKKEQHVLVVNNFRSLYPIDVICWREDYIKHSTITYWMPLPPPPTTEESSVVKKEK